jgi:hypothetical protein
MRRHVAHEGKWTDTWHPSGARVAEIHDLIEMTSPRIEPPQEIDGTSFRSTPWKMG